MKVELRSAGTVAADANQSDRMRPASNAGAQEERFDQAHFSFDGTRVRTLEAHVLSQPEVRQERVELLRQSLGKGEYAVSDGQIADAMLADMAGGSGEQLMG